MALKNPEHLHYRHLKDIALLPEDEREEIKWLVSFKATAPDGSMSTAQHVITFLDEKKYTWESINRQRGGEVLPSLDKIEVVRSAAQ